MKSLQPYLTKENIILLLIMINTDLEFCKNELIEVINMFGEGADELNIRHFFSHKEGKIVNTVSINGHAYAYGNLFRDINNKIVEKRLIKRYAKLAIYKALSKHLGKDLPWGALTGIRPTKLAYMQIEEEGSFEDSFINTFRVSAEKTELTKRVIDSQKNVYVKNDKNTDFFVFIPFCPSKCKYCSFISADIKASAKYVDQYVECLIREIRESAKLIGNLRSIYIGGGTPVCLPDEKLEQILCEIDKFNTGVEFTVEAGRPDAITENNLTILKAHKVTRICLNPQTFQDKTLIKLGRSHTAKDIIEKYQILKDDFSVNMDLICGLEGETFDDFKDTLLKTIALNPDNITVHTLCIKKGSTLAENTNRLTDGQTAEMVDFSYKFLLENGYNPYYLYRQKYMSANLENVGYAKVGKECLYNIDVMEEISQNIACGSNAISKRIFNGGERIERLASPKDLPTYMAKLDKIIEEKRNLFENI